LLLFHARQIAGRIWNSPTCPRFARGEMSPYS
jgi:hypothetical protein